MSKTCPSGWVSPDRMVSVSAKNGNLSNVSTSIPSSSLSLPAAFRLELTVAIMTDNLHFSRSMSPLSVAHSDARVTLMNYDI
jgi:hypothetical protein